MCDTFVVPANLTADGAVIFGKNTDREPNEAHEICIYPAADHLPGSMLQCTYLQLPQVQHTYGVLLAKPFWMWGAEMGMNEHGLAIGNEAIFTRVPYETGPGLTGMDYLRLALERSKTAYEALQLITGLLEVYGQGGNCGFTHPFYYHNSFILADPREAWVLETAGRQWVAEKAHGVRTISNAATIGATWDLASADLVHYAVDRGWCKGRNDFHFARCYSDFLYTTLGDGRARQACTTHLLTRAQGQVTPKTAMQVLRSHGTEPGETRHDHSFLGATVCMHAGPGPVRNSQSVGSLVAHLSPDLHTAWVTGTSAPCTSIFKPLWLDAGMAWKEPSPTGKYDPACLWWRHEAVHRAVLHDYAARISLLETERDRLEDHFMEGAQSCGSDLQARRIFSVECFHLAERAEQHWSHAVKATPIRRSARFYYQAAWKTFMRQAGMDETTLQRTELKGQDV